MFGELHASTVCGMSALRTSNIRHAALVIVVALVPGLLLSACVSNYAQRETAMVRQVRIPLPSRQLLKRPAMPKCMPSAANQSRSNGALSERVQLEFERDCYRRAERRVRAHLIRLQKAVRKTRRVAQRSQRAQGSAK